MALDNDKKHGDGVWKSGKGKGRRHTKGRQLLDQPWDEVKALLGTEPRRADLLIEHLHKIQDTYGHLSAAHLRALAEEMRMSMAEVYEVATFYAHFDVVKEDGAPPPALLSAPEGPQRPQGRVRRGSAPSGGQCSTETAARLRWSGPAGPAAGAA